MKSPASRSTPLTIHSLEPEESATLLALAHAGGWTTGHLHTLCWRGLSLRTAQLGLAKLEGKGLLTQHHRSVRVETGTVRLPSIWELSRTGARLVREHPLAPEHVQDLAKRTMRRVERLGAVVLAIIGGVPDLAGITLGLMPAIHPQKQRSGRADALVVVHRPRAGEPVTPPGAMPWMPQIDAQTYDCTALIVELDDGVVPSEGPRQRARAYAEDSVWRETRLRLVPLPVWVIADSKRQATVSRAFGAPWAQHWLTVTDADLSQNRWIAWNAAKRIKPDGLGALLDHLG